MNRAFVDFRDMDQPSWLEAAEAFALRALEYIGIDNWEVSLVFCGDDFIKELNREYRDLDEPTDVLSFPMGETVVEGGDNIYLAGDIVVSLPALARNCDDFSVDKNEELKRLILHGILHLSGLDHSDNSPMQPMLSKQEEILKSFSGEKIL
jgi:probable rRNA maturation factor